MRLCRGAFPLLSWPLAGAAALDNRPRSDADRVEQHGAAVAQAGGNGNTAKHVKRVAQVAGVERCWWLRVQGCAVAQWLLHGVVVLQYWVVCLASVHQAIALSCCGGETERYVAVCVWGFRARAVCIVRRVQPTAATNAHITCTCIGLAALCRARGAPHTQACVHAHRRVCKQAFTHMSANVCAGVLCPQSTACNLGCAARRPAAWREKQRRRFQRRARERACAASAAAAQ